MADLTDSKSNLGDIFPVGGGETTWQRTEPLVTPSDLRDYYLFGIPLVSGIKDPFTGKPQIITDPQLNKFIDKAVSTVEAETGLFIFPVQFEEKLPFDKCEYESFGFFRMVNRPISTLQSITVNLSNNTDIYQVPIEWVETALLARGQINIIPLTVAMTGGNPAVPVGSAVGATFMAILGNSNWISSFWKFVYIAGYPDGKVPKMINTIIGLTAAIDILSQLAPTYGRTASASLSLDGASQSVSGPGPQLFKTRIDEMEEKKKMLVNKLKKIYGMGIISSNV